GQEGEDGDADEMLGQFVLAGEGHAKKQIRHGARRRNQHEDEDDDAAGKCPVLDEGREESSPPRPGARRRRLPLPRRLMDEAHVLYFAMAARAASTRPLPSRPLAVASAAHLSTTGASAELNSAVSSCERTMCSLPESVATLMPALSELRQISPTRRSQSSPQALLKASLRSSGRASQRALFMETWNVVVPSRQLFSPSIWYFVESWSLSAGMISQGMSAPSTAWVVSACGRSLTGMGTGVAPSCWMTAMPVGPGTRSFLPLRSAG